MAFHIVRNDITRMNVDAIVNSANPKPTYAYGTDLAIYTAAGADALLQERKAIGNITPGSSAVTSGGNLRASYIIHTVAPSWEGGGQNEFEVLRSCYEAALEQAKKLRCKSMAFPLLATGVYGFPKDKALQIAMSAIQTFLLQNQMDIFLVVFDEKSFVLSGQIFDEIQSYVDANYVADANAEEYSRQTEDISPLMSEDEALRHQTLKELQDRISDIDGRESNPERINRDFGKGQVLNAFEAAAEEDTFQEKLFEYIDRGGMKASEIYRSMELSRQQYSRIQSNKYYQPRKNTALLFAIVLHLNISEATDLLSRAGFAFNPSSRQDMIVKACLIHGQYDLYVIDAMMQKNHLDTLIDYDGKRGA